jgi:hypothetical protein
MQAGEWKASRHMIKVTPANDAIIVCAGGILPTPFLKEIGVMVETKFGTE